MKKLKIIVKPNKYKHGKIYYLHCLTTDKIYIGSTIHELSSRLSNHVSSYNQYLNGKCHWKEAFKIIENGNYVIELIEEYPCYNKRQLEKREAEYVECNDCINIKLPFRTKESENERRREQYQKNKYRIKCVCGVEMNKKTYTQHIRESKSHKQFMKKNPELKEGFERI